MALPPSKALKASGIALSALLLATACGGDGGGSGDGDGNDGDGAAESADSLAGEGFLALACSEDSITVSRFSAEDGSLEAEHVFDAADATAAETPHLPNGRAIENLESVELPDCETDVVHVGGRDIELTRNQAHELAGLVVPDGSLLLVDLAEEVDGATVRTIGAMTASGEVEGLLPADEAGGFSGVSDKSSARYHHADDTVYYLESDHSDDSRTVLSLSLESGDAQEVGPCEEKCERIILDPYSGVVYGTIVENHDHRISTSNQNNHARYFSAHDGSMVGFYTNFSDGLLRIHHSDDGGPSVVYSGAKSYTNSTGTGEFEWQMRQPDNLRHQPYNGALPVFTLDTNELMLSDNSFTVRGFDSEFTTETEDREILPGSSRTNEYPILSADRDSILFRSTDDAGSVSWFTVPVSGDEEPQEIGVSEGAHSTMVPIHWF